MTIDTNTAKTSELVAFYNKHIGEVAGNRKPVKKFKDRKTAEDRVEELMGHLGIRPDDKATKKSRKDALVAKVLEIFEAKGKVKVDDAAVKLGADEKQIRGCIDQLRTQLEGKIVSAGRGTKTFEAQW